MQSLTAEGQVLVEQAARGHNVSADAILTLLRALDRGGGTQAQFSHPDLGGMGQWSRGGMIMVGDMFNNGLKARVDSLCIELSDMLRQHSLFHPEARGGDGSWGAWWPAAFGTPSSVGSQNDMHYAFFPTTRRLAIKRNGVLSLYDTGDHRIGGASQQQGSGQDVTFTSQFGIIHLKELPLVGEDGLTRDTPRSEAPAFVPSELAAQPSEVVSPRDKAFAKKDVVVKNDVFGKDDVVGKDDVSGHKAARKPQAAGDDDVFDKIERLHELQKKGILSEAEFTEKKKELLARI